MPYIYCPIQDDGVLYPGDCYGCDLKEDCGNKCGYGKTFKCAVCGVNTVDAENGYDTCHSCSQGI